MLAALELDTAELVTRPDDADVEALGLTGFAASAAAELAAEVDDPEALDALALLHRLAATGGER